MILKYWRVDVDSWCTEYDSFSCLVSLTSSSSSAAAAAAATDQVHVKY